MAAFTYTYPPLDHHGQLLPEPHLHPHSLPHLSSLDPVAHVHYIIVPSGEWAEADVDEWDAWTRME